MRKILSLLGAISLASSSTALVVACGKPKETNPMPSKDWALINNSQANMHGGISHIAKQIILADQYQLDWNLVKRHNDKLVAKEIMPKNINENLDSNDFNLDKNPSIGNVSDQYFSNSWLTNVKDKDNDIKLDGKKGASDNQLGDLLTKLGLGSGIGDLLKAILPMLDGLNKTSIDKIVGMLPMLDGLLPELVKDKKDVIDDLLAKLDVLFKEGSEFVKKMDDKLGRLAIRDQYAQMQAASFMPAMWITLSNGIGLILKSDYKQVKIPGNTKPDIMNSAVFSAGKQLASVFKVDSSQTATTNDDILGADFERYSEAVVNIVQALQFLQLHLSLFDDSWSFKPTDSNHLFSGEDDNKTYMRKVLGVEGKGESITVESVLNKIDVDAKGVINLRYLISVLKTAIGDVTKEDNEGYALQRLLFVILSGPQGQKETIEGWGYSEDTIPSALFATGIIVKVVEEKISNLPIPYAGFIAGLIGTKITPGISYGLSKSIDAILTGKKIGQYLEQTFDNVLDKIESLLSLIPNKDDTKEIKEILEKLFEKREDFKNALFFVINKIPVINEENSWKELWSGNPLDLSKAISSKDELISKLEEIFGKGKVDNLVNDIFSQLDNVDKSIKDFLPDSTTMNLRNILLTPIGKMAKSPSLPSDFGDHYLKQNVVGIINEIADYLHIESGEKINDDSMKEYNFDPGDLKGLWDLIKNYTYQWDEQEAPSSLDEANQSNNLITLILRNPDKASKILGLKDDKTIGEESFLDFVLNKLLRVNNKNEGDRVEFIVKLLTSILNNLNDPKVDYQEAIQEAYGQKEAFKFEFSELNYDKEDEIGILGETLKVTFRNTLPNDSTRHDGEGTNEYVYTFHYSRDKVENNFEITKISKQLKTN